MNVLHDPSLRMTEFAVSWCVPHRDTGERTWVSHVRAFDPLTLGPLDEQHAARLIARTITDAFVHEAASVRNRARDPFCDAKAALLKLNQLARELKIPDTNHTFSKARMFLSDAVEALQKIAMVCGHGRRANEGCGECPPAPGGAQ